MEFIDRIGLEVQTLNSQLVDLLRMDEFEPSQKAQTGLDLVSIVEIKRKKYINV